MPTLVLDPLAKLTKDLKQATTTLAPESARYLVDYFYQIQRDRIRAAGQIRSQNETTEPDIIMDWLGANSHTFENNIRTALSAYSNAHEVGRWSRSIKGIGPVIAAGLLAHIDIVQAPTVGHIWRFAGLDPTVKWLGQAGARKCMVEVADIEGEWEDDAPDPYAMTDAEVLEYMDIVTEPTRRTELNSRQIKAIAGLTGRKFGSLIRLGKNKTGQVTTASMTAMLAKRPWNGKLKTLCWKIGESFVKVSNHDDDVYGHIYAERKRLEVDRNEAGLFLEQAEQKLEDYKIGKDTEAYKWYADGKLPPAHIHSRAKRYAVKLFLAAWHEVCFFTMYGTMPPKPYILTQPNHTKYLAPPNWPM